MDYVDVSTGEVKALKDRGILSSSAFGSCVGVVAYDPRNRVGALAHIMLPRATL